MTDHYEDEEEARDKKHLLSNSQVLAFIGGFWLRRRWLLVGSVGLMLVAIGFDLALPWAAGRLVDAMDAGTTHLDGVWKAWAAFVGVYLAFALIRNVAFRFWIPLAAYNMEEVTNEGFAKVQSFSADWHASTFAGSTVRRLSRAMWGYDAVSDAVVLWFGPAILVLVGQAIFMMTRWPAVGAFALMAVALYIGSNIFLTNLYARPANL